MKTTAIIIALIMCNSAFSQQHYTPQQLGLSLKYGSIDRSSFDVYTTIADDLNNDRFEDVVKLDKASGMLNYYINEGNGYLKHVKSLQVGKAESISLMIESIYAKNIIVNYGVGSEVRVITSRELNRSHSENEKTYGAPFIRTAGSEFEFNEVYQSEGYQFIWNCAAGDIDNDGKNEVIFAGWPDTLQSHNYVNIYVYESAPNNTYVLDWDTVYVEAVNPNASGAYNFVITDIDNDGNKEFCFWTLFRLKFYECYGPGQYKFFDTNIPVFVNEGSGNYIFKILEADVNHDGKKELIVDHVIPEAQNPTRIYVCTFASKSSTHFNFNIKRINFQGLAGDLDVGDINGDGRDEIIMGGAGFPNDELYYFDSTGTGNLWWGNGGAGYELKIIYTGRAMGAAYSIARDLNGDGKKEWLCSAIGQGFGGFGVIRNLQDSMYRVEYYDTTLYNALGAFIEKVDYNNEQYVFYPRLRLFPTVAHGYLHIYKYTGSFLFTRIYDKDFYPPWAQIGIMNILDIDNDNKLNIVSASYTNDYITYAYISDLENEFVIGINNNQLPVSFKLYQNYPNPFNPASRIKYQIPKSSYVKLEVYDILGRSVKILVNQKQTAGSYEVEFDGSGFSSGVYFYRLKTDDFTETKKMLMIK
jgi:hypothetical protein